ncbi:MAG: hypothetical protein ACQESE_03530 [Nanobdellota archaeon]
MSHLKIDEKVGEKEFDHVSEFVFKEIFKRDKHLFRKYFDHYYTFAGSKVKKHKGAIASLFEEADHYLSKIISLERELEHSIEPSVELIGQISGPYEAEILAKGLGLYFGTIELAIPTIDFLDKKDYTEVLEEHGKVVSTLKHIKKTNEHIIKHRLKQVAHSVDNENVKELLETMSHQF